jgi:RNA polymerase sigma-70 factor (ECF subfamily)
VTQLAAPPDAGLEEYRRELTGYCYRMLGSTFEADDAVQDTLVRAWQASDSFEGRSSLRSWLYRIATNVCLDQLRSRKRRALPMDLSSATPVSVAEPGEPLAGEVWIEPMVDPADEVVAADTVRLAFVAALQHLPARQRAVLLLREVLCWSAAEVAELLDTTVVSVNSALQRARATLSARGVSPDSAHPEPLGDAERALLAQYVSAFEAYDIDRLVGLLHEDAGFSMPPLAVWLRGRDNLRGWYLGYGSGCRGSRLVPLSVNGMPGFAHYKPSGTGQGWEPWSIQALEFSGGEIVHIHHFLDTALFGRFGLPSTMA